MSTPSDRLLSNFKETDGTLPIDKMGEALDALREGINKLAPQVPIQPVEMVALHESHMGASQMFLAQMFLDMRDELDQMWQFLHRSIGGKKVKPPERTYTSREELKHIAEALALDRMRRMYDFLHAKAGRTESGLYTAKRIPDEPRSS